MKCVAIIGMGTMGSVIAGAIKAKYEIIGLDQGDDISRIATADIVIIAVKPQSFTELSRSLRPHIGDKIVLSIMAGVSLGQITEQLGAKHVVRSMPSLGLVKSKSLTAAYGTDSTTQEEISELLALWGEVVWLEQESDFDLFTAIAGSGPAYLLEFVACLQKSAEQLGFDKSLSRQVAGSALISATAMLDNTSAEENVQRVASRGGTTEAALNVFAAHQLSDTIFEAVRAAADRSRELSGGH